jgi:beta-lactam-binding protein with PASTA domain
METVDNVVGMPLAKARYRMAELGYSVLVDGAGDTVTAQMPSPGAKLAKGSQVMLYTYTQDVPRPEELVCVPDVSGMGTAQAASMLRQRTLEMEMNGNGFAVGQEPMAGAFVPKETTIRVTFEMPGS